MARDAIFRELQERAASIAEYPRPMKSAAEKKVSGMLSLTQPSPQGRGHSRSPRRCHWLVIRSWTLVTRFKAALTVFWHCVILCR
jgi:hypothetical protein